VRYFTYMDQMPDFCLHDYDRLVRALLGAGYALGPVEELPRLRADRAVLLRHDVDLHIPGIERVAEIECDHGVAATYFVPLTLHFNPFYPENRAVLRRLVEMGHRIGLHYDLNSYPRDRMAALEHLDREVNALSALLETKVEAICMHFPWEGQADLFCADTPYVHPHSPRYAHGLLYVSDSCRAWRDETLLRCFSAHDSPRRLLLNTHPELWLGEPETARYDFARSVMLANVLRQHRAYVVDVIVPTWERHVAPTLHDQRERHASSELR
jgi:hypothetical protein